MSGADYFALDQKINPYYDDAPVDVARAIVDHANVAECFRDAGIEVVKVAPPAGAQDGIYTANWALIRGRRAILARLPDVRKMEEDYAEEILTNLGYEVFRVPDDWHFSGQGDNLIVGKYLISGSGYRSDARACEFAARELDLKLVQIHAIPELENGIPKINSVSGWPDSRFYDIDLALGVIRDDLIAYCPAALDEVSRTKIESLPLETIEVDYDEAVSGLACNLVSTGETVIMSARAPKLRNEMERRGFRVLTPDVHEIARGGGFIRCVALTLN